ncbi:Methyltransferase type 11 [Methylobacterium sp. 4-46]|uniref:class I SAM-dependent methyltransferase n=1 Tax=unclassified Methylobacterium TaxID=2615210 RepID=UPI000165CD08|nr:MULTISPECIES: class I SAM-dependent methyltransferase [Methylobacterium]ACA20984.1 Methyltransferase type 11 [Methylobacterium sp. 4-46]WFT80138.1 class I SAM-dependent methyltransferase [Methylobacterium nodulans]
MEKGGQDSLSGLGSSSDTTILLKSELSSVLSEIGCSRLIDVGCGDFNWMKEVRGDWHYIGIDVAKAVIERNNELYRNENRTFEFVNAVVGPIPKGDVVLCREVLFHLSFDMAISLIKNVASSGAKFLLATSDSSVWFNSDIRTGDYRRLNLMKSPFRFPKPIREIDESKVCEGRVLGLWPMEQVQQLILK